MDKKELLDFCIKICSAASTPASCYYEEWKTESVKITKDGNGREIEPVTIKIIQDKENRFSSDDMAIYTTGEQYKVAHELAHAVNYLTTGKESMAQGADEKYLADPGEVAAHAMEFGQADELTQQKYIVSQYVSRGLMDELNVLLDTVKEVYAESYARYMDSDSSAKENSEDELFYCDKLADEDVIMGTYWHRYIHSDMCTLDEWIDTGLDYVEDLYSNEEIDKDDYDEYIEYYKNFEV